MRILYVDIDTLRPDHLGCYGYHRSTSPNIDELAARGVRFSNVYASDVPCLPSRTALISGMFGIRNGVANHGGVSADLRSWGPERSFFSPLALESFAGVLMLAGYHTTSISSFPLRHQCPVVDLRVHGIDELDARVRDRAGRRGAPRGARMA